jgi:hypothetical protein
MKAKDNPEISHADAALNSAPALNLASGLLGSDFIRELCGERRAIQLPPAPIGKRGRGDPPSESKPGKLGSPPTSEIQLEECSQSISDPPKNGKSSPAPLDPIDYFPCSVGLYVRVFDEGETAGSGYAHFDSDPKFCSALVAELNRGNRKVKTFTVKGHIESVAYLVAELLGAASPSHAANACCRRCAGSNFDAVGESAKPAHYSKQTR